MFALWAAGSAAAQVIVVRSTGAAAQTYPAGRRLPDTVRIRLRAGESVTILGARGSRIFRGPGQFSPADPARAATREPLRRPHGARLGGIAMSTLERGRADGPSVLVVRAAGPSARSFPPGHAIPAGARIGLRAGDTLVLLGVNGTRTFRGPGTFSPGAAAMTRGAAMAAPSTGRRARIGAVRDPGSIAGGAPSIWHVDATQSGTVCLTGDAPPTLWRPDAAAAASLSIVAPDGRRRGLDWPAGSATLGWPADMPVADGGVYELSRAGALPTRIDFRIMRDAPGDLQALAEELIARGCQNQVDLIVETAPQVNDGPLVPQPARAPVSLVDVSRGGNVCIAEGHEVALRRPRDAGGTRLTIAAGAGPARTLDWPAGSETLAWPRDLAIADGATFDLSWPGAAGPIRITTRLLPRAATGDAVALAGALIERGCAGQLDLLVQETAG